MNKSAFFKKIDELIGKLESLKRNYNENEKGLNEIYIEWVYNKLKTAENFIDNAYIFLKYSVKEREVNNEKPNS